MANIDDILADALGVAVEDIRKAIKATGQYATGRTSRSLEVRVKNTPEGANAGIWGRPYAWSLETGSKPASRKGSASSRQQFIRDLYEWCRVRGLPDGAVTEEQRLRFAKFLKWHINKMGTQLYRQGGRRDVITPSVEKLERELPTKIGGYYITEIAKSLDKLKTR